MGGLLNWRDTTKLLFRRHRGRQTASWILEKMQLKMNMYRY